MSTELIKAVLVKPDGVYLYSKSNNSDRPFDNWKCESLTDIYNIEGQQGLDREIVRMLCEYARIEGNHPSIKRYQPCLQAREQCSMFLDIVLEDAFDKLSPEDIKTLRFSEEQQTTMAKAYNELEKCEENKYYTILAQCAAPLTANKHKQARNNDSAR